MIKKYPKAIIQFKRLFRPLYYKIYYLPKVNLQHKRVVDEIRKKGSANVVFFASTLAMWKYQGIYDLLRKDTRFNLTVILAPIYTYSPEQNTENIKDLKLFFDSRNIHYEDSTQWNKSQFDISKWLKPDILFYVQIYDCFFGNSLDFVNFYDRLLCYVPYAFGSFASNWSLNSIFQNVAWKLYYDTYILQKDAKMRTYNRGTNIVVVGSANADGFMNDYHCDVWKPQKYKKKRVIWAPHFTIEEKQILHRGSFLWLNDLMMKIAIEYKDKIQFAFKPHPRLRSVLYNYPGWGKERTDEYYEKWEVMPNTQIENSSFVDLFMTSDALIHDCGSFTVEYHYSKNPCLFTTCNLQEVRDPLNELGQAAIDAHYIGMTESDIRHFLDDVVLGGKDPKRYERETFYSNFLLPPNDKSAAQNIYDDIILSLFGDNDRKSKK